MDYGEVQKYLLFQHDKYTNKPLLDENSELIPRKEYLSRIINRAGIWFLDFPAL